METTKIFRVVYNKVMNGHIAIYEDFEKTWKFIHTDHSSHVESVVLMSRVVPTK